MMEMIHGRIFEIHEYMINHQSCFSRKQIVIFFIYFFIRNMFNLNKNLKSLFCIKSVQILYLLLYHVVISESYLDVVKNL